jgi:hypothetical protein
LHGVIVHVPAWPHVARIKFLFAGLILWLPLQYVIAARFGEPYPALVMPSFPGTMADPSGNIRFGNVRCKIFFRNGDVGWVSTRDVLAQAPSSHHGAIMEHMFSPPSGAVGRDSSSGLTARLFPGRALSQIRQKQKELDPQTKEWLKRRIQVLYPSQPFTAVTFVWYDEVFIVKRIPFGLEQDPTGLREVRFE